MTYCSPISNIVQHWWSTVKMTLPHYHHVYYYIQEKQNPNKLMKARMYKSYSILVGPTRDANGDYKPPT